MQRGPRLVPHAAVVAGDHTKDVFARREIRVLHVAVGRELPPVAILPFELVAKLNFFRRDKTERSVIDLKIADFGWEAYSVRRIVGLAIRGESLNVYWWRNLVTREMLRINYTWASRISFEPYFPV